MDWCRDIDYGSLPQWVGILGGLGAFCWTLYLYGRSLKDKELEQARLVSVFPLEPEVVGVGDPVDFSPDHANSGSDAEFEYFDDGGPMLRYRTKEPLQIRRIEVHNRSEEVVSGVTAQIGARDGSMIMSSSATPTYLRPGEKTTFVYFRPRNIQDWFSQDGKVRIRVWFTDNSGRRWRKTLGGPIERVEDGTYRWGLPKERWFWRLPLISRSRD